MFTNGHSVQQRSKEGINLSLLKSKGLPVQNLEEIIIQFLLPPSVYEKTLMRVDSITTVSMCLCVSRNTIKQYI